MKYLIFLLFSFSLTAADFQTAEQLFAAGEFGKCGRVIEELLPNEKLPPELRNRLLAMQEYLLGVDPAKIAETVKQAQKIATHREWVTTDQLNHATLLIRRAEDWKSRGIPEYQELSDAAGELLKQTKDGGDVETALKIVFLQTKNWNLNGEYTEPLKLILETLRLYYPARRLQKNAMPGGAIQLLLLAGDQYVGSGVRANDAREKINDFSQAAKYYLHAINALPPTDPRFQELCDRLHNCRETLRLLGYRLDLPSKVKPQSTVKTAMIDEMLRHRRFHDAILALENNPDDGMRIRYAVALSACGKFEQAWAIVGVPGFSTAEPSLLLITARNFLAAGKKTEAAQLLQNFLELAPDNPDVVAVAQQCAQLLIEAGNIQEAAACFLKLAAATRNSEMGDRARFSAAQCFYQAEDYEKCLALIDTLPSTPERTILAGQAEIRRKNYPKAIRRLEMLLKIKDSYRSDVLKLLTRCGMATNSPKTMEYAETLLTEYPADPEGLEYAKHLFQLYEKHSAEAEKFQKLGEWLVQNHLESRDAASLIPRCANRLKDKPREQLLRGLLQRNVFSDSELLALFEQLEDWKLKLEFGEKYCRNFVNRPERCALFLDLARLEYEGKKYSAALVRCETLLAQNEVYQYKDIKMLQAETLSQLQRHEEARKCCQELLLAKLSTQEKQQAVLMLARSWEQSQEHRKAIAVTWTVVPIDGKAASGDIQRIKELLQLIIRNAKKINSQVDQQDAEEILNSIK